MKRESELDSKSVPHAKRAKGHGAALVTIKLRGNLPSLRTPRAGRLVERIVRIANDRLGMRICQYSVLSNHVHLLVDSDDHRALARAMQGLNIRLAKALNRLWHRSGKVFGDRYHSSWVRGMSAIRRAARYVLQNARKHGVSLPAGEPDPYSSAPWFPWKENRCRPARSSPVAPPPELSRMHHALRPSWPISIHSWPGDPTP